MSLSLHHQAGELAGRADHLAALGRRAEAARLYHQAALIESEVFAQIPIDRPRTRAAIAVSALALFLKAGAHDEGLHYGCGLLECDPPLPGHAIAEIARILRDMRRQASGGRGSR